MTASKRTSDAAKVRFPPPLIFVASIALGWWLQRLVATGWPAAWRPVMSIVAGLCIALGCGLLIAALLHFLRTRQNPEPWVPTPELIIEGVYRWTRNPMYLGMALVQAGIGLAHDNLWILVSTPVSCWLVSRIAIRPEEAYLGRRFGDAYQAYRRSVRRWFGRLRTP